MVFIFTENEVNNCFSIYHTSELQVISRLATKITPETAEMVCCFTIVKKVAVYIFAVT